MDIKRMPVAFLGHGSPMTVLEDNQYTQAWSQLGINLKNEYKIKAVVTVSAHWLTPNVRTTSSERPKTIHDFYGFPDELFQIQYPSPGAPEVAETVLDLLGDGYSAALDADWGLDHGSWALLYHMFPEADVPVVQLSLNYNFTTAQFFELGQALKALREQNVLVLGSGNIVHNLSKIQFARPTLKLPQAVAFDDWFAEKFTSRNFAALAEPQSHEFGDWALTSGEHYWPALVIAGMIEDDDTLNYVTPEVMHGSISMRGFTAGLN